MLGRVVGLAFGLPLAYFLDSRKVDAVAETSRDGIVGFGRLSR